MAARVVDICGLWYDRDCWRYFFTELDAIAPMYFRRFARVIAEKFGVPLEEFQFVLDRHGPRDVTELLVSGVPEDGDPLRHRAELAVAGVGYEVVHSMVGRLPDGTSINDRIADLADRGGKEILAWAGIGLADVPEAVAEIRRCADAGMKGISISPFVHGISPSAPECRPVFDTAADLGLPVWIHNGGNFCQGQPMDLSSWRDLDLLAGRYPGLVLIAGHSGWPWILEMVAVAQRHPGVYIDISTHRPRRMARAGSGFEPLLRYGTTTVRDKVLFGSGGPWVHSVSLAELVGEVVGLGLDGETTEAWLGGNAVRLLGVDG
ncbi:amidohydrolase family protein [Amycolatopsis anabasis]|uniref:amidohydrolase family protein n=1 Tax=Amycolatopsis anabasis TaxID=1840409 RepID=UPI00131BC7FC|nr:amidohydrolase family protein [Amycolatopsis anabasis]